jgi:two-component system osmolarity sensor histidine kinase EnvZ
MPHRGRQVEVADAATDEIGRAEQSSGCRVRDGDHAVGTRGEHAVAHAVEHRGLVLHERGQLLRLQAEGQPFEAPPEVQEQLNQLERDLDGESMRTQLVISLDGASRIREGEYDSRLDEDTSTREIREVNRGFNRMARELAKIEEDRAVMLAGISHDLRTPLARMRLEAEMSVADEDARRHMADDIDQLDAIIDKFMDYARPNEVKLVPVALAPLVDKVASAVRDPQITIEPRVAPDLKVMTDEVELSRVFANLFENARRYGRSPDTGVTRVQVTYAKTGHWIIVNVRDHGPGVPPEKLAQLTTPFYRGDAARTHAQGAGLGLAIVEKAVARMGGQFDLANAPDGGFVAHLRLRRAA